VLPCELELRAAELELLALELELSSNSEFELGSNSVLELDSLDFGGSETESLEEHATNIKTRTSRGSNENFASIFVSSG
jgi:hypothetical protein